MTWLNLCGFVVVFLLPVLVARAVWLRIRRAAARAPVLPPASVAPVALPRVDADHSEQLLLCDATGEVEHEVAWHRREAPETYSYAGKTYRRMRRVPRKRASDRVWEYRR